MKKLLQRPFLFETFSLYYNLGFGGNTKIFTFSLNDNYTYIPDKEGGSPLSKSVEFYEEKEEIISNEKKITANKGSDSIGIFGEKNPVINLTFYILSSKDIKGMQSIGLAYKFDD